MKLFQPKAKTYKRIMKIYNIYYANNIFLNYSN